MASKKNRIKKIITLLKKGKLHVKLVPERALPKGTWGTCSFKNKKIKVWKKLTTRGKIYVLIHECTHFLKPKKSERWVRKCGKKIFDQLTELDREELESFLRRLT